MLTHNLLQGGGGDNIYMFSMGQQLHFTGAKNIVKTVGVRFASTIHQFQSVLLDGTKVKNLKTQI